ncbi:MAG: DUF937 domain-containing protein [Clostridia bacterium]|nr:DUF937 domain-containing protein [Clostridia bacterium]
MDLNSLMDSLLSSESVKGLSKVAKTSQKGVKGVLSSALPALLEGAQGQAKDAGTAESFVNALASHAKDDTSNITSFLSGVDLSDGSKIVSHLLGSAQSSVAKDAAEKAGISTEKSSNILSAAAPLLMSLIGQQTAQDSSQNNSSGIASLMGSLLGGADLGSLVSGALGGSGSSGGLLGGLLGLFKK